MKKFNNKLNITIVLIFTFLTFGLYYLTYTPEKFIMPFLAVIGITITLISLKISVNQWNKNRLEFEILKKQLDILYEYL